MLNVSGLVIIPKVANLQEIPSQNGTVYLTFSLASQDDKKNIHRYNALLTLDIAEVSEWKEKLTSGTVFYIHTAKWRSQEMEKAGGNNSTLLLNKHNFKKLTVPYWWEQSDGQ